MHRQKYVKDKAAPAHDSSSWNFFPQISTCHISDLHCSYFQKGSATCAFQHGFQEGTIPVFNVLPLECLRSFFSEGIRESWVTVCAQQLHDVSGGKKPVIEWNILLLGSRSCNVQRPYLVKLSLPGLKAQQWLRKCVCSVTWTVGFLSELGNTRHNVQIQRAQCRSEDVESSEIIR